MRDVDDDEVRGSACVPTSSAASHRQGSMAGVLSQLTQIRDEVRLLDGMAASELLAELDAVVAVADGLRLAAVAQIEASQVWRDEVNGTAASFLRRHHLRDHSEAGRDLKAVNLLSEFPVLQQAVDAGRVSRAHVDVIARIGLRTSAREQVLGRFMHIFVETAAQAPVGDLRQAMRAWACLVDDLDPGGLDAASDEEHRAHERRYLFVSAVGDGVKLDGYFAPEAGAKIQAVLNSLLSELFRSGSDRDPVIGAKLASPVQRADAMENAMDRLLASGQLPTNGGAPAAVTVTVPLARLKDPCCSDVDRESLLDALQTKLGAELAEQLDAREATGEPLDFGRLLATQVATVAANNGPGHMVLSVQAVQRMTCDCNLQRILLSPEGLPMDVGRSERLFTPAMRKALAARDGGCVFPWCDKPPSWSQAHHIKPWSEGGRTSLDNATLLCSNHHHQVHAHKDRVYIGEDGRGHVDTTKRRRQ